MGKRPVLYVRMASPMEPEWKEAQGISRVDAAGGGLWKSLNPAPAGDVAMEVGKPQALHSGSVGVNLGSAIS